MHHKEILTETKHTPQGEEKKSTPPVQERKLPLHTFWQESHIAKNYRIFNLLRTLSEFIGHEDIQTFARFKQLSRAHNQLQWSDLHPSEEGLKLKTNISSETRTYIHQAIEVAKDETTSFSRTDREIAKIRLSETKHYEEEKIPGRIRYYLARLCSPVHTEDYDQKIDFDFRRFIKQESLFINHCEAALKSNAQNELIYTALYDEWLFNIRIRSFRNTPFHSRLKDFLTDQTKSHHEKQAGLANCALYIYTKSKNYLEQSLQQNCSRAYFLQAKLLSESKEISQKNEPILELIKQSLGARDKMACRFAGLWILEAKGVALSIFFEETALNIRQVLHEDTFPIFDETLIDFLHKHFSRATIEEAIGYLITAANQKDEISVRFLIDYYMRVKKDPNLALPYLAKPFIHKKLDLLALFNLGKACCTGNDSLDIQLLTDSPVITDKRFHVKPNIASHPQLGIYFLKLLMKRTLQNRTVDNLDYLFELPSYLMKREESCLQKDLIQAKHFLVGIRVWAAGNKNNKVLEKAETLLNELQNRIVAEEKTGIRQQCR